MRSWRQSAPCELSSAIAVRDPYEAFAPVTEALAELLTPLAGDRPERVGVALALRPLDVMLTVFIEDLVEAYERDGFRAQTLSRLRLGADGLRAAIEGTAASDSATAIGPTLRSVVIRPLAGGELTIELVVAAAGRDQQRGDGYARSAHLPR
jgi:hypothetical protein